MSLYYNHLFSLVYFPEVYLFFNNNSYYSLN